MPQAWSDKRERQYENVKKSEKKRGRSEAKAKEIASRTVNKQRRKKGETKSGKSRSEGTGNPNTKLEDRSYDELYNRAKQLDISGRSSMRKGDLIQAIRKQG